MMCGYGLMNIGRILEYSFLNEVYDYSKKVIIILFKTSFIMNTLLIQIYAI